MNSAANVAVPSSDKTRRGRRRWLMAALLLIGVATAAWFGRNVWQRPARREPPVVELTNLDPAIAAAVRMARQQVLDAPDSAEAWGRLGKVLIAHEFRGPGNACFVEAERLDPNEPRWPYYQGISLSLGDPDAAIPRLERAVQLCGNKPDAVRLWLAEVLLGQGRFDEAESHFRAVLADNPRNARAVLGLGRLAWARDRPEECVAPLERATTHPSTRQAALMLLAQVRQRLKDPAGAQQELLQAAQAPGDLPWPDPFVQEVEDLQVGEHVRLGRAGRVLNEGKIPQGIRLVREVIRDYPSSARAWRTLGQGLIRQGNYPAAEDALREAVQHEPAAPDGHYYLGIALVEQRKLREAAASLRRTVELKPDHAEAFHELGRCLAKLEDRAGAIEAFRSAVRCKPDLAAAHADLGDWLLRAGQKAEALVHLRQAVALNPGDTKTRERLRQVESSGSPMR